MEEDYSEHYNPYIAGKALRKDEDFFGREKIIREVKMTLEGKQNNMVVLFGQRRIGKTSILNKLERALKNPPFLVINFDLLDKAKKPINDLLFELAVECARKAEIEFNNKESFFANPDAFHSEFLPVLYKKLGENKKLVLLFDEFDVLEETGEKLPETAAANAFHRYIRQLNVTQSNIYFVFVVGRRMEELGENFLSTFKEASHIRVFVLEKQEAVSLIRRGESEHALFEKEAIEQIIFYTHGHPFFTQLLCQEIFNSIVIEENGEKQIITKKMVEDSLRGAIEKAEGQFVWIWKGLPPAEQIVFSAIAENTKSGEVFTDDDIAKTLQQAGIKLLARELNIAPSKLVEWGMLEKIGKGYRFYFEILRRWVEENQKLDKVKEELEKISPLAESLYQTAFGYYRQNNMGLSLLRLQEALDENPNHFRARLLCGTILYEKKEYEQAINELKQAYRFDEKEVRYLLIKAMLDYGSLLESQSKLEDAEKIYDEIIQDIYENEETTLERKSRINVKRGDEYRSAGDVVRAYQAYLSAGDVRKMRTLIMETEQQAEQYEMNGELKDAIRLYYLLTSAQPEEIEWRSKIDILNRIQFEIDKIYKSIERATALQSEGEIEGAFKLLNETHVRVQQLKHRPSPGIQRDLENRMRNLEISINEVNQDIIRARDSYEYGDLDEAKKLTERILSFQPQNRTVLELREKIYSTLSNLERGEQYYKDGNIPSAKKYLDDVLAWTPKNERARQMVETIEKIEQNLIKSQQAYELGDFESVEILSRQILNIHPSNQDIVNLTEKISEIKSTYEKAKNAYDQGDLKSASKLVDSVLLEAPKYNDAISLKKNIDILTLNLERAESAYKSKSFIAAQKHLDEVLRVQPSNPTARKLTLDIEKNLNKLQRQSRLLPVSVVVAIISSCATIIVGVWAARSSPLIANLFLPQPTLIITSTAPTQSTIIPSATFVDPTLSAITPSATSDGSFQLFDNNRFLLLPLSSALQLDGTSAPVKTAVENLQLTPGYHTLLDIPFEFRNEIYTQNETSSNYPQTLVLPTSAQNPLSVFFLIQADFGYARYSGKQLGKIVLVFENEQRYEYPLVMGENIRDYKRGVAPEAVTQVTSSDIIFEWEGVVNESTGGIDLLKVSIPAEYQSSKLTRIEISDTSLETTGEIDPGIRILAASVEIQDPTPGPWEYQVEQVPAIDTSLNWFLNTNDTLILTGGSLKYQDYSCSGSGNQICVLVITSTKDADVTISSLVPKNNWLAVTRSVLPDEAVISVTSEFWLSPNCGTGCSFATVAIFSDGVLANSYKVNNPNLK